MKKLVLIAAVFMVLGIANVAQSDIISGLVAYYPFNGNANDQSGNGYNGILSGAVLAADRFGNGDRAYSFDGNDDYIDIPLDAYNPTNLTLNAWINLDTLGKRNIIIGKLTGEDTSGNLALEVGNLWSSYDRIVTHANQGGAWSHAFGGTALNSNTWYQITATYDGSYLKVFLDGDEDGSTPYSQGYGIANIPWMIGTHAKAGGGFYSDYCLDGIIDDVRIYDRALSADDIKELYNERASVSEPTTMLLLGLGLMGLVGVRRKI